MTRKKATLRLALFLTLVGVVILGAFLLTQFVTSDDRAQAFILENGYIGILIISFVAGLNLFIPVPAATFVPIFTAGGMTLPVIISLLVVGTMAANFLAYYVGRYGGSVTKLHYPSIQNKLLGFYKQHHYYLPYFIFFFTALIPLPDEVFLIPLGIIGISLRTILVPLLLGTIFYQTFAAVGVQNLFWYITG